MTIRNAFENCLIELNKVQAPSLLVDDFIYLFNKSVQQYINKRYNLFETKQQLTDDLRVLTKTQRIDYTTNPKLSKEESVNVFGDSYRCELPDDYVHMLNCICEFKDKTGTKCAEGGLFQQGANKLDTSQWSHVINNAYMKPSAKRPYYYIINIEDPDKSNIVSDDKKKEISKDQNGKYIRTGIRYGNSVQPIMQIKCGSNSRYELEAVYIDYLRAPEYLSIDRDILDTIEDESQVIEFPDYVVYEIINEIVKLVMENGQNPRIQTNPPVNQTVA